MKTLLLTPEALAARWCVNAATLSQWRWNGYGPKFLKIGKRIFYRFQDIEDFEERCCFTNTSLKTYQKHIRC